MKCPRQLLFATVALGCTMLLALQFFPPARTNPPRRDEPAWDSPRTAELTRRACYDCHSNETKWPAYTRLQPAGWWISGHVTDGRRHLNFSVAPFREADEAAAEVRSGEMPLKSFTLLHPEARLTPAETTELITGLTRTFGSR